MTLAEHYRALGLRTGAPFDEVKASYRRLVRRYHPDVNPGDQRAQDKFIQITKAYQALTQAIQPEALSATVASQPQPSVKVHIDATQASKVEVNPRLTPEEQRLKQDAYAQLQVLFRGQRFPRAIALVEGLAQRIANDSEVRQWQAITYQRWGRYLISQGEFSKARIYLRKALRTDPHNKSLWMEVNRDFRQLEHQLQQFPPSNP